MQGCIITMLPAEDEVVVVKLKLKFWYQHVECNQFYCCYMMNEYLEGSGRPVLESVKCDGTEHPRQLQNSFEGNFPPNSSNRLAEKSFHWIIPSGRFPQSRNMSSLCTL